MTRESPIFSGRVKDGKLTIDNDKAFGNYLHSLNGQVSIEVRLWTNRRTLSQNAYYWGVVLPLISDWTGNTVMELHEIFKRKFLPPKVITYLNKEYTVANSTADQNISDFIEYVDQVIAEAQEMGINIPPPNTTL